MPGRVFTSAVSIIIVSAAGTYGTSHLTKISPLGESPDRHTPQGSTCLRQIHSYVSLQRQSNWYMYCSSCKKSGMIG
eukprot:scaffold226516_cov19-Prasinocladus_malaysianus.AAC.1